MSDQSLPFFHHIAMQPVDLLRSGDKVEEEAMKYLLCVLASAATLLAGIAGRIVDARGGEPLARVRVRLVGTQNETSTNSDGRYRLEGIPAGAYMLQMETVGYRLMKLPVRLEAGQDLEVDVVLSPDTFQRTDTVEVRSGPFDVEEGAGPSAPLTLSGAEVKNLSTVLMDDPIRAVHALPGVAANDDFQSQFTLRGADFRRIGLYIDDVLMHVPFHTIADEGDASISMLNGEMVSDMLLLPIAFPARYSDRTGSVLELRTREGSRSKRSIRVAAGVAATTVLAEAPFAGGKGSWIASARKSYLQYLLQRLSAENGLLLGYTDAQARVGYSLTDRQQVNFYVLGGVTDLDRSALRDRSGVNALIKASNRSAMAKASWQYTPVSKVVLTATGAWLRERSDSSNRDAQPIDSGTYGEWIGNARGTWQMSSAVNLEAGWSTRRIRDQGYALRYLSNPARVIQLDTHRGTGVRSGGYLQQSWVPSKRVRLTAGARWDKHDFSGETAVSPNAALSLGAPGGLDVHLGWGQYVQFPELAVWTSPLGGRRLLPERANHISIAVEKRVGEAARIRVEAWNRDDRDLLARPFFDFRLVNGAVPAVSGSLFNSIRGYSRGIQLVGQTRSANRLSGWASYTLSYARQRDALSGVHSWADADQRHLANSYLTYRITPSLNLSGRWAYGSGEPLPGFLTLRDGLYYLSARKNDVRLPSYQRLDIRANKSFAYDAWKLTLYGEAINLTNRTNMRFVSFDGVNTITQRAFLTTERVFPIVPVAGVTLEF